MGRVGRALFVHELLERTRDRWVLVISVLFALLASSVSLYGRSSGAELNKLVGPSLVTLASLLVPLVALVLGHDAIVGERERNTLGLLLSLPVGRLEVVVSKFLGRASALALAVLLGLGTASAAAGGANAITLLRLFVPTLLLGLAFLSIGVFISALAQRQVTAASVVVVTWFLLVFFYDLGVLGLLVVSDGRIGQQTVAALVIGNPAGLYRVQMMQDLAGGAMLQDLGVDPAGPGRVLGFALWAAWVIVPVLASGLLLQRRKVC